MGRWGLSELPEPTADVVGLMTHLATADTDPDFAREQVERFEEATKDHSHLIRHAANSAAALRLPESRFDAARCGIALYGLSPFGGDPSEDGLEPALRWESRLAQVKRLRAGESAGYGRRFVADEDTWIGVVPVGYADGFRRDMTGTEVVVEGARCSRGRDGLDGRDRGPARPASCLPTRRSRSSATACSPRTTRGSRRRSTTRSCRGSSRAPAVPDGRCWMLEAAQEVLAGEEAWIVGGAVRDELLGRAQVDLDIACREPEAAARRYARLSEGAPFPLSERHGAWRVALSDERTVDFTPLPNGIHEDLATRDFTINAIARPLAGGQPLDPFGGLGDLDRKTLRAVAPGIFRDDPLRLLRAVRLEDELGFRLDAETERLVQAGAGLVTKPAGERILAELVRLGAVRLRAVGRARAARAARRLARAAPLPRRHDVRHAARRGLRRSARAAAGLERAATLRGQASARRASA